MPDRSPDERMIDGALKEAHDALMFLLMQGTDMGHIQEAYLRTCEHLIDHIRNVRDAHPMTPLFNDGMIP